MVKMINPFREAEIDFNYSGCKPEQVNKLKIEIRDLKETIEDLKPVHRGGPLGL